MLRASLLRWCRQRGGRSGSLGVALAIGTTVLLASLARGGSVQQLTAAERRELLADYQPVTYFREGETWPPTQVASFLKNKRLQERSLDPSTGQNGPWRSSSLPLLPTSSGACLPKTPCYRLDLLPCVLRNGVACYQAQAPRLASWVHTYVYARVLDVPTPLPPLPPEVEGTPRYVIRYWYFYDFDDWQWPLHAWLRQIHEADWESVTIDLSDTRQPLFVAYSAHCGGFWRPWSKAPLEPKTATHPRVYVALGSHANYFDESSPATRPLRCRFKAFSTGARRVLKVAGGQLLRVVDRTGHFRKLGPRPFSTQPTVPIELPSILPRWAHFAGVWSEGNRLYRRSLPGRLDRLPKAPLLDDGPGTPNFNSTNLSTIFTSASWIRG